MAAESLGWVHLQDFGPEWWEHSDWEAVRQCMLGELARLRVRYSAWRFLCLTGDMTRSGDHAEFECLNREMDVFITSLEQNSIRPELRAVPGDRDLVRPTAKHGAVVDVLRHHETFPNVENALWSTRNELLHAPIREAFAGYMQWVKSRNMICDGFMPGDFSAFTSSIDASPVRLSAVGLNSAALQLGAGNYKEHLALHSRQFASLGYSAFSGDGALLFLTHHPLDWLTAQSREDCLNFCTAVRRPVYHLHGGPSSPADTLFRFAAGGLETNERGENQWSAWRYSVRRGVSGDYTIEPGDYIEPLKGYPTL